MQTKHLLASAWLAIAAAGCGDQSSDGPAGDTTVQPSAALPGAYTFGIGSGISSSDLKLAMVDSSEKYFLGGYPNNSYIQGTYSSRFTKYPEALWSYSTQSSTVPWLRNAGLFDNEQVWQIWYIDTSATLIPCGPPATGPIPTRWTVSMDYDVDSELNYDYLVINSSDESCSTNGVARKVVSGKQSGTVSFDLPRNCPSAWVGISYSKDGSVSVGNDMGRVKNVNFAYQCPVGL